jgi:parallel beta-helix repeat protein
MGMFKRAGIIGASVMCVFAAAACSGDDGDGDGTTGLGAGGTGGGGGGDAGSAGTGGDGEFVTEECVILDECTTSVSPSGDDDTKNVQTALIADDLVSGSTVCFCPGQYDIRKEISVKPVPNLTVKGLGSGPEATLLDFINQTEGDDGFTATANGITIENFWVKNTPGNGIVVDGAEDVVFRNLKVTWDGEPRTENGAYAVYPTHTKRVIVEYCEVVGASDAGIYVGQSVDAIVRHNNVHGNVAGIEVENTIRAEIHDNRAYDNSGGIFVPLLQHLEIKESQITRVYDNEIFDNNRENFGAKDAIISALPQGTGLFTIASDNLQIDNNTFTNNQSTAILVIGHDTMDAATGGNNPDPENDRFPEKVYVFENTFDNNGHTPRSVLALGGVAPLEDFLWDGVVNPDLPDGPEICLSDDPPSFRALNGFGNLADASKHSLDVEPYKCDLPLLDKLTW